MTAKNPDAWRERLVAALYGELPPAEEEEFRAALATDAELRTEWEELQAMRGILQRAREAEPDPEVIFLAPPHLTGADAGVARPANHLRLHLGERLRRLLQSPVIGLATVSAALLILILAGLRVDRVENGLAVHFGPASEAVRPPAESYVEATSSQGAVQDYTVGERLAAPASAATTPAEFITRQELVAVLHELMRATDQRMTQQQQQHRGEMSLALQQVYETLTERSRREQAVLSNEIQQALMGMVGMGVSGFQGTPKGSVKPGTYQLVPVNQPDTSPKEDDQHD